MKRLRIGSGLTAMAGIVGLILSMGLHEGSQATSSLAGFGGLMILVGSLVFGLCRMFDS